MPALSLLQLILRLTFGVPTLTLQLGDGFSARLASASASRRDLSPARRRDDFLGLLDRKGFCAYVPDTAISNTRARPARETPVPGRRALRGRGPRPITPIV
jgi:hypothetical protein